MSHFMSQLPRFRPAVLSMAVLFGLTACGGDKPSSAQTDTTQTGTNAKPRLSKPLPLITPASLSRLTRMSPKVHKRRT